MGWLTYVLHRIDVEYEDRLFPLDLSTVPSELWNRHGYSTFQDEPLSADVIETGGHREWALGVGLPASGQRVARLQGDDRT